MKQDFVNDICKYFYHSNDKNLEKSILNFQGLYVYLNKYIRNLYEIVPEVPLILLYELKTFGINAFEYSLEEYEELFKKTEQRCKEKYY